MLYWYGSNLNASESMCTLNQTQKKRILKGKSKLLRLV